MSKADKTHLQESPGLFRRCLILSDGKTGDLVQCRGVAGALGVVAEERIVAPTGLYALFMPFGPIPWKDRAGQENSPIAPPMPDLVIAAGWRTLAYLRAIKKRQQGSVFTVFLKNPRCKASYVDLIWAPCHDGLSGKRIISSLAGPHRFSPRYLAEQYAEKPDDLRRPGTPLAGVLLGGESRDYHFTREDCLRLARSLRGLADAGAGLAITPSRRSSGMLKDIIRTQLEGIDYYWWDEKSENPYGYLLAHSDFFVVTADSANMVGETCVSGKPVYVFRPSGGSKKFDRMLEGFERHGATRPLPEKVDVIERWSYQPLYAAADIAREIGKRAARQFEKGC